MAKKTKAPDPKKPRRNENVRLTDGGFEKPDGRSLVAVCDLRPVTMGERVRKYQRTPQPIDDALFNDPNYDPDDFHDDEDRMMSPHEERAADFMERRKKRKMEKDEKRRKEAEEKQAAELRDLRNKLDALKEDIPKSE